MLYILEGPDGGGKTTLAERLSVMTKAKIKHFSYPETDEEKAAMFINYLNIVRRGGNVILDRCWYSDMCYGPILRGESNITYPQMYTLERHAAAKGAMVIYCTDQPAILWQRATARGEEYVTSRENFDKICKAYEELYRMPHLIPVVRYEIVSMY